jgi:hypothetical protein
MIRRPRLFPTTQARLMCGTILERRTSPGWTICFVEPISSIGLAAFSRADMPAQERRDFFVYVDEFQSFTTLAVTNMLSELRKYRVGFTIGHQYLHQLEPDVRHAVLGNVGTLICFRLGAEDAPYFVREFVDEFDEIDLMQLPNYRIYVRLMIDGAPSKPFSATTLPPGA